MKSTLLAIMATAALAVPAIAQQVYFGGSVNNGDFETAGSIAPFNGIASSHSTGTIADHTTGTTAGGVMAVDLTANNGQSIWKLLTTPDLVDPGFIADVEADVDAGLAFSGEMWVYVPSTSGIGTPEAAVAQVKLEPSYDGGATYDNGGSLATQVQLDLTGAANKDAWRRVAFDKVTLPAGTTHVRTRAWYISTVDEPNGVPAETATPADWNAAGYSGFVYFDDFRLESVPPPDPNILIFEDVRNGDLETGVLSPWNVESGAGSIGTAPGDPVNTGNHSLGFNVAVNGDGNRWKQFNNVVTAPVSAGDRINGEVWVYVPGATTFDPSRARFNFLIRSDNGNASNGSLGNFRVDLLTAPRDAWFQYTWQAIADDGANPISEISTQGWHLETQDKDHAGAANYSGLVYLDDFKLVNIGPTPPGILVDEDTNNGDIEATANPWVVSGAGSISSDFDHTTGTGTSVKVDLTKNNSNQKWKGLHNANISHPIENYTKADISAWVYIPAATTIDDNAKFNLPIRDGTVNMPGAPSLNLQTAARDTWIEVSVTDYDVSGFTTSLAINNWNIETVSLLGPEGSTVRSDGKDGTEEPPPNGIASDLPGPAMPQDWIDAGYDGFIYFDDISVRLHTPVIPAPLEINSIAYDYETGEVTINYNSTYSPDGADVFISDNGLADWTFFGVAIETGNNQEFVDDSLGPDDTGRLYIFVEPGTVPPDPTP